MQAVNPQVYTGWNTLFNNSAVVCFEYVYWSKDKHETINRERQKNTQQKRLNSNMPKSS